MTESPPLAAKRLLNRLFVRIANIWCTLPFPLPGTVVLIIMMAIAWNLIAWIPVVRSEPTYIRIGIPTLLLLPFYLIYITDRAHFRTQSIGIAITVIATFLGTSLAFIQADIQSAQNDKDVFSRMLDRVMYQMSAANEGREMTEISKPSDRFYYTEAYFTALRDLLASEKTSEFLSIRQAYELDLAYRAITTYARDAGDLSNDVPKRQHNVQAFFGTISGTYANACALRASVNGGFDYNKISKIGPAPHFISFNKPTDELIKILPPECRSVPKTEDIYDSD